MFTLYATLGLANLGAVADVCQEMTTLVSQARTNFDSGDMTALTGATSCALSQSLAGNAAYTCAWQFSFRDQAATTAFDAFNTHVGTCFAQSNAVIADAGVNHPDTYFQRLYTVDGATIRISLKDKSALQQTYVFVGIQRGDAAR